MKKPLTLIWPSLMLLATMATPAFALSINGAVEFSGRGDPDSYDDKLVNAVTIQSGEVDATSGDLTVLSGLQDPNGGLDLKNFNMDSIKDSTIWTATGSDGYTYSFQAKSAYAQKTSNIQLDIGIYGILTTNNPSLGSTDAFLGYSFFDSTTGISTTGRFLSGTSAVPIPAAGWLFGSAILGLAGVAKRRKTAKP